MRFEFRVVVRLIFEEFRKCESKQCCHLYWQTINMMLAWSGSEREASDDFIFFVSLSVRLSSAAIYIGEIVLEPMFWMQQQSTDDYGV